MTKVRLNYDGWLALPAAARRALGVDTGDQLEVEVIGGRIVLRPLKVSAADGFADKPMPVAMEPEAVPAVAASPSEKRSPGRPRKAAASLPTMSNVLPPRLKARGAKRKAAAADEAPR
jgi:AbrB family looped-hinge helix DNA binding protein